MIQKYNKSEIGFSLFVVLAAILVIAAIGVGGYLVYQRSTMHTPPTHTASSSSGNSNQTSYPPAEPNVTYSGKSAIYASKIGGFSLTFPKTWAVRSVGCSDGLILLGADSSSVGACGSENFGQMAFAWQPVRTDCGVTPAYYTDINTQSVSASGVSGTKTTATAKEGAGVPIGTKIEQYCYVKDGISYIASYTQSSNYPNALTDFEAMATSGLNFK